MKMITYKIYPKHTYTLREDLYKEWKIWSQCFGKVLIINGTSSAGKTTLSKYLHKFGFNLVKSDDAHDDIWFDYLSKSTKNMSLARSFLTNSDLINVMYEYKIKEKPYNKDEIRVIKDLQDEIHSFIKDYVSPTKIEIYDRMYEKSKKFIFSGQDVILDLVARGNNLDMLSYSFNYYPMKIGLLYTPLEENLRKCFQRNYISLKVGESDFRSPSTIMNQYKDFYKFISKDSVSKDDKIFEKIDKDVVKNILEIAVFCEHRFIDNLQYLRVHNEAEHLESNKKWVDSATTMLKHNMMLENSGEVFVVPAVKYDFIIKNSDLKKIHECIISRKVFFASKEMYPLGAEDFKLSTQQMVPRTEHYTETHPSIRFLIYYTNPGILPTIRGNTGSIVELEYDNDKHITSSLSPYHLDYETDVVPTFDDHSSLVGGLEFTDYIDYMWF